MRQKEIRTIEFVLSYKKRYRNIVMKIYSNLYLGQPDYSERQRTWGENENLYHIKYGCVLQGKCKGKRNTNIFVFIYASVEQ